MPRVVESGPGRFDHFAPTGIETVECFEDRRSRTRPTDERSGEGEHVVGKSDAGMRRGALPTQSRIDVGAMASVERAAHRPQRSKRRVERVVRRSHKGTKVEECARFAAGGALCFKQVLQPQELGTERAHAVARPERCRDFARVAQHDEVGRLQARIGHGLRPFGQQTTGTRVFHHHRPRGIAQLAEHGAKARERFGGSKRVERPRQRARLVPCQPSGTK